LLSSFCVGREERGGKKKGDVLNLLSLAQLKSEEGKRKHDLQFGRGKEE